MPTVTHQMHCAETLVRARRLCPLLARLLPAATSPKRCRLAHRRPRAVATASRPSIRPLDRRVAVQSLCRLLVWRPPAPRRPQPIARRPHLHAPAGPPRRHALALPLATPATARAPSAPPERLQGHSPARHLTPSRQTSRRALCGRATGGRRAAVGSRPAKRSGLACPLLLLCISSESRRSIKATFPARSFLAFASHLTLAHPVVRARRRSASWRTSPASALATAMSSRS